MSNLQDLPTGDPETFIGELEEMNLDELKDKIFGVAISTGPRDGKKYLCGTLRAPLNFYEMVEMVGTIYHKEQVHSKVIILSKKLDEQPKYLDMPTIDFIEANYMDIITDGLLDGALQESKEYTCRAGFLEDEDEGS